MENYCGCGAPVKIFRRNHRKLSWPPPVEIEAHWLLQLLRSGSSRPNSRLGSARFGSVRLGSARPGDLRRTDPDSAQRLCSRHVTSRDIKRDLTEKCCPTAKKHWSIRNTRHFVRFCEGFCPPAAGRSAVTSEQRARHYRVRQDGAPSLGSEWDRQIAATLDSTRLDSTHPLLISARTSFRHT